MEETTRDAASVFLCPDCGTVLKQIERRPGREPWVCPVALEAQRRGLIGQDGRRHRQVTVYGAERKPYG